MANCAGGVPDAIAPANRSENDIDGRNDRVGGTACLNEKRSSKEEEGSDAVVVGASALLSGAIGAKRDANVVSRRVTLAAAP